METLNLIYWYRVGLGIIAAFICVVGWVLTGRFAASVIEGVSLAIIFYIITYYILKTKFIAKVEKTSKLLTTGIGAYFLTWIVSWVLMLTLILSPTVPAAAFTYLPTDPKVNQIVTFNATTSRAVQGRYISTYSWNFGDNQGQTTSDQVITHNYTSSGSYTVLLYVIDDYGLVSHPQTAIIEIGSS